MTSYNYKKIISFQNKNDVGCAQQKQLHYKRLLSEFKNILEFKYITIPITTTTVINDNICEIDIINSIISNNNINEDDVQQLFNINKNKYIESIINKNKTILQNQNNQYPQTIQFIDIQLFIIQSSNNNNWYIYENNCNIIKEEYNKQPTTAAITITILISLNSNNNMFNTYINYQLGSISTKFQNNNNNNNINLNDYFIANRFKKPFTQLSNYYYIVNSSFYKCFLEMANDIRDYIYQGTFEIHVSVDQKEENNELYIYKFKEFCQTNKLKSILIELSNGKYSNQMMTSSHHHCENLKTIQLKAYKIAFDLLVNEFNVSRLKIEILASCTGVPINDFQQQHLSPSNYFEFHIKLLLPTTNINNNHMVGNNDIKLLKELMVIHNGHLSKNSFKISTDNTYTERFLTIRLYNIGKDTAMNKFESCKNQLIQNNFNISSSHREYSIYDSNIKLDEGWIE